MICRQELETAASHNINNTRHNTISSINVYKSFYTEDSFSFCQIMLWLKISPQENPFQILENIENSSHSYVFIIRNMNVFESYCSEAAARGFISTKQTSFL